MKTLAKALLYILTFSMITNCVNDDALPVNGKIQFNIGAVSSDSDNGKILSHSFPDGAYILLSIESASNASIYSFKRIELIKLGDEYVTSPLSLTEGRYHLTDFLIMSNVNEILYAAPKAGSDLAVLVTNPLPLSFEINSNEILNLGIQVVSVDHKTPKDFGYVLFEVERAGNDFSISLFAGVENALHLTSGTLHLYQENELVYTQNLEPKVNVINFKGDPNASYKLVVIKEGYTIKTKEYKLADLTEELNKKPLAIILSPAATILVDVMHDSLTMGLALTTSSLEITIDWGDGIVEHPTLTSQMSIDIFHKYEVMGKYYINITGELNSITGIRFPLVDYQSIANFFISSVDITQLSELQHYSLEWLFGPERVDFSHNIKLQGINVSLSRMQELDISNNPMLRSLVITSTLIPLQECIKIIDDLYGHAVANNIRDGVFVYDTRIREFGYFVLPEESLMKLKNLQNSYGWYISPALEL